jgi:hypothetical protein
MELSDAIELRLMKYERKAQEEWQQNKKYGFGVD